MSYIEKCSRAQQLNQSMCFRNHAQTRGFNFYEREEDASQVTNPLFSTACCMLEIFIHYPFNSNIWSEANREVIIRSGKPSPPDLKNLPVDHQVYSIFPWLTGCPKLQKLFCWPCMISNEGTALHGTWSIDSKLINELCESIQDHESSAVHDASLQHLSQWNDRVSQEGPKSEKLLRHRYEIDTLQKIEDLQRNDKLSQKDPKLKKHLHLKFMLDTLQNVDNMQRNNTSHASRVTDLTSHCSHSVERSEDESPHPLKPSEYVSPARRELSTPPFIKESSKEDGCIINRLLHCPFLSGSWTSADQYQLIQNGRPANSIIENAVYNRSPWLAESVVLNKLFCWPCLLFSVSTAEIFDLQTDSDSLDNLTNLHENSNSHMNATLLLKICGKNLGRYVSVSEETYLDVRYTPTQKHLQLAKYLIDIICITHTKIDNTSSSLCTILKILNLISSEDAMLGKLLNELNCEVENMNSLVVALTSKTLTSIELSIQSRIVKEIKKTPVVSLIMNQVEYTSWVSIIVRYTLQNGAATERFIKLLKIGMPNVFFPQYLLTKIDEVLEELGCRKKLVGYTYDGGVLSPNDICKFNEKMRQAYPQANFYHERSQHLRVLLLQLFMHLPLFRRFHQGIHKMAEFMDGTPKLIEKVMDVDGEFSSDLSKSDKWEFTSRFITTLDSHYAAFVKLFDDIANSSDGDFSAEVSREAAFFSSFIKSRHHCFLIACVARIFRDIDGLSDALQRRFDVEKWKKETANAVAKIQRTLREGYEEVTLRASEMMNLQKRVLGSKAAAFSGYLRASTHGVFKTLLHATTIFITSRILDVDGWDYFDLFVRLSPQRERYKIISKCGSQLVRKECPYNTIFSPRFHPERLKAQLQFMQERKAFLEHDPGTLCKFLVESELEFTFSELFKFGRLALTVPLASRTPVASSTFARIETYARHQKSLSSDKVRLFVERKLLKSIQKDLFNDMLQQS